MDGLIRRFGSGVDGMLPGAVQMSVSGNGGDLRDNVPLMLQGLGNEEGKLKPLRSIQTRIAMGVVAVRQAILGNFLGPANAFRHVLAGQFKMNAPGVASFRLMNGEKRLRSICSVWCIAPGPFCRG